MFIKDKNRQEGLIHICEGKTEKWMRKHRNLEIVLHDIHFFTTFYDDGKYIIEPIKFCPYCGSNLEKEAFENA